MANESWFGVRCVFRDQSAGCYEERITLWKAAGLDAAIELAETEAHEYCAIFDDMEYTGLAQCFAMGGDPIHGAEVFSLLRDSGEAPEAYVTKYFATGSERQEAIG